MQNHKSRFTGECWAVERIERQVAELPGIKLFKDSSRKYQAFGKDVDATAYQKVYHLIGDKTPQGYHRIIKVKFHYDHRINHAMVEGSYFEKFLRHHPEVQQAVTEMVIGGNGRLVFVKRLDGKVGHIEFSCPKCGEVIQHICGEKGIVPQEVRDRLEKSKDKDAEFQEHIGKLQDEDVKHFRGLEW